MMEKQMIAMIAVLLFAINGAEGEPLSQNDAANAVQQADTANQPRDRKNPDNTPPAEQQRKSPQSMSLGEKSDRPVSANKVNYFSIHQWPGNNNTQIKFQISIKFRVLEPNLYVLKYNIFPAYVIYTQKSLWNVGRKSMPFEESNYNPEFFLDYPINAVILGRFKLRNLVFSPIEHESNGLPGIQSRNWNRQYVLIRLGLESKEKLETKNAFLSDKALLYVKLWRAVGYSDQDDYLHSIGKNNKFSDFMGRGEIGISIRNFLWRGSFRNHQLDIKTPIFRDSSKNSYEFEFRQQVPNMNFALYLQYWYGYGETLMRFDRFGHRGFVGLSFSY